MMPEKVTAASTIIAASIIPILALGFETPTEPALSADIGVSMLIDIMLAVFWSVTAFVVTIYFTAIGQSFLSARDDPDKAEQARLALKAGLIGVAIIGFAFSIVSILRNALGA